MWGDEKMFLKLEWSEKHNYNRDIPVSDEEPGAQSQCFAQDPQPYS